MNRQQQPENPPEQQPPAAGNEVQKGSDRGIAQDERLKRVVKQHPQRDEPRVDSVEPGETPS